jgi:hypothetical protein
LGGATAARQHRHPGVECDAEGSDGVFLGTRHDDADRLDLVNRRVRGITAARCGIEEDFAADFALQPCGKRGIAGFHDRACIPPIIKPPPGDHT